MLGPAPVVDLDGTVVRLPVDWSGLRRDLGVGSLRELTVDDVRWAVVQQHEEAAADIATPLPIICAALAATVAFAVLTANSESSAWRALRRAGIASRCAAVVGRRSLAGRKDDVDVFRRGLARCVTATADARAGEELVYLGDSAYELDYAARSGARTLSVQAFVQDLRARP